jgi:hypothetical protein
MPPEPIEQVDVTEAVSCHREAIRHLWNTLIVGSSPASYDTRDAFEEIGWMLLQIALMVPRPGYERQCAPDWRTCLRLIPSMPDGIPIMIENPRQGDQNRYWDHPIVRIGPNDAELAFAGYFDWDESANRDYQYFLARVATFPDHPELTGRRALIEVAHAKVIMRMDAKLGENGSD